MIGEGLSMEDKKMKGKMDETPTSGVVESKLSQCLRLGSSPVVGEPSSSKTSNDLDSSMKSSEPSDDRDHKENPPLEYACQYCDRKFSSSQALGGHQNGHRHERLLKKEEEKFLHGHEFGAHFSTHPYPRMVNNYQHSPSHLYFGARFQRPVAPLPSFSLPRHSSLGYGHYQGLQFSNTSLSGQGYGNSSGSSLGGSGAIPPRYNLQGVRLFHGINQFPPPANNEEANHVQAHAGVGNPLENSSVSPAASQASEEMDLTLKLGFP